MMATKVDQPSLSEQRHNQSMGSPSNIPATVTSTPKISMRAVKAGVSFVIPKNKLSGALVPVVRGGGKVEKNDSKKEEVKQPQRKTKWGIDLALDAAVRRGRALAYQTRAEQIATQLEFGNLESDSDEATGSSSPSPIYDSSGQRTNTKEARKREKLDLERREAIGECIRLNPNYKPPTGHKPVYKESKINIPVESLGLNIVGLILGPQGNTKKRLEEETGTKITIEGRVRDTKQEKVIETMDLDIKEVGNIYEELYVNISADTYEKVDAAVSLLELLMTPVDGNIPSASTGTTLSSSGDSSNAMAQVAQVAYASQSMPNADLVQNYVQSMPIPSVQQPMHSPWPFSATQAPGNVAWQSSTFARAPGNHSQTRGHWYSMGANNSAMQSHSGISGAPTNAAYVGNANMFPRTPQSVFSSFQPPPFFRGRPPSPGFNMNAAPSNVRNLMPGPVNRPRPPLQVQERPYVEMASQNQSTVMNNQTGVFGSSRPPPLTAAASQSSQVLGLIRPNDTPPTASANIMGGWVFRPPVPHGGDSASASRPTAMPSHGLVPQPSNGPQQPKLQLSQSPSLVSHAGSSMQVPSQGLPSTSSQGGLFAISPLVISPVLPSPGLVPVPLRGSHTGVLSAVASPRYLPPAPQGAHPALPSATPTPSPSPLLPSPRLPPPVPQRAHAPAPPSPGLPPPSPQGAHVAFPRPLTSPVPHTPGFSPAPPQTVAVSVPPVVPSPPVIPAGITIPVISSTHTPVGTMPSTASNIPGIPVAMVQSGVVSRPIAPPPVSAGATYSAQGSNGPLSAPNSWQPQHLSSGDFTFQPLRSQAQSSSVWLKPSQPTLSEVQSQNPVPISRPAYQPAVPNLPHSRPGQMRVNAPPPPAPTTSVLPSPPMPPLPPQAPSFRPAMPLPSTPLSTSMQPTFSVPSRVSVSHTTTISPPGPGFVGLSQQMLPRPPVVLSSAPIPTFGSSALQTIRPLPPQTMQQSGSQSFVPFSPVASVPNIQRQGTPASQPSQNPSPSNISVPPPGPFPPLPPPPRVSSLPGNVTNQGGAQQQNSPGVFPNILPLPSSNVRPSHIINTPHVQIPSSTQVRPILSGQLPASSDSGSSQSYDPFSPTSIPVEQSNQLNDKTLNLPSNTGEACDKQETDAEYENLMESVGVR